MEITNRKGEREVRGERKERREGGRRGKHRRGKTHLLISSLVPQQSQRPSEASLSTLPGMCLHTYLYFFIMLDSCWKEKEGKKRRREEGERGGGRRRVSTS